MLDNITEGGGYSYAFYRKWVALQKSKQEKRKPVVKVEAGCPYELEGGEPDCDLPPELDVPNTPAAAAVSGQVDDASEVDWDNMDIEDQERLLFGEDPDSETEEAIRYISETDPEEIERDFFDLRDEHLAELDAKEKAKREAMSAEDMEEAIAETVQSAMEDAGMETPRVKSKRVIKEQTDEVTPEEMRRRTEEFEAYQAESDMKEQADGSDDGAVACKKDPTLDLHRKSPWFRKYGEEFKGKAIPFGCGVYFKPARTKRVQSKAAPALSYGIFLGYRMAPGNRWTGQYIVADIDDFVNRNFDMDVHFSEFDIRPHYTSRVEMGKHGIHFPLKERYDWFNYT